MPSFKTHGVLPAQSPSPSPPPLLPPARIVVSPRVFVAFWWCIILLHLGCVLFATLLGGLHAYTAIPANYTYSKTALQVPRHFLLLGARTFACIALLHVAVIARILYNSLRRRQLCFRAERGVDSQRRGRRRSCHGNRIYTLFDDAWAPLRWLNAQWERRFGIDGTFGLNGPHFETAFYLRKTTEILSQTYQTYYLSVLLANRFINALAVGVILTACFTAPVLRRAFPETSHRASQRFASLLLDLALDVSSSVGIPLYTLYSTMKDFDWHRNQYPIELSFDSVWLARQTAMGRFLLVWSTLDFLSTTVLQLSLLGGIVTTARCLRRSTDLLPTSYTLATRVHVLPTTSNAPLASSLVGLQQQQQKQHQQQRRRQRCRCRWLPVSRIELLFVSWGLFVLVAHLSAQANAAQRMTRCRLVVHPWFTARPACSVVVINCHREQINDSVEDSDTVTRTTPLLEALDGRTLTTLVVTHCVAWTMPPVVQRFPQLQTIVLYNVTLRAWDRAAAVTQQRHPALSHVFLGDVRMAEFPRGLLHEDVPRSLTNVEVSRTNLSSLPEELGDVWSANDDNEWVRFHFENSPLTRVPASFWRLGVRRVSFINSAIERIADDALARASVEILRLSGNPLKALPSSPPKDLQTLHRVTAERTQLTALPAWVEHWWRSTPPDHKVSFHGTPLCRNDTVAHSSEMMTAVCSTTYMDEEQGIVSWETLERLLPVVEE